MWNIILFVSLIIVAAMSIVSNAIEIGEKLGSVHIAVEIAFYVLIRGRWQGTAEVVQETCK